MGQPAEAATASAQTVDERALELGVEFVDLGDEWGWRSRYESAIQSDGGYASKAKALENAEEYLRHA